MFTLRVDLSVSSSSRTSQKVGLLLQPAGGGGIAGMLLDHMPHFRSTYYWCFTSHLIHQPSYLVLCTLIVQFFKLMMMMMLLLMRPEMRMRILKMTIIVDSWTDARPCFRARWAFYLYSDGWTNMLYLGMSVCIHGDSREKNARHDNNKKTHMTKCVCVKLMLELLWTPPTIWTNQPSSSVVMLFRLHMVQWTLNLLVQAIQSVADAVESWKLYMTLPIYLILLLRFVWVHMWYQKVKFGHIEHLHWGILIKFGKWISKLPKIQFCKNFNNRKIHAEFEKYLKVKGTGSTENLMR